MLTKHLEMSGLMAVVAPDPDQGQGTLCFTLVEKIQLIYMLNLVRNT